MPILFATMGEAVKPSEGLRELAGVFSLPSLAPPRCLRGSWRLSWLLYGRPDPLDQAGDGAAFLELSL